MTPIEFIAAELGLESVQTSERFDALGLDSLEFLDFLLVIENKFGVPTTASVDCVTVLDLLQLIRQVALQQAQTAQQ